MSATIDAGTWRPRSDDELAAILRGDPLSAADRDRLIARLVDAERELDALRATVARARLLADRRLLAWYLVDLLRPGDDPGDPALDVLAALRPRAAA